MAPPAEKKKRISVSDNRRLISSTAIGENEQQQPMGSLVTSFGKRQSVRVAQKMNNRILKKIWICTDVLMDILPFFDRPQLGLKLALLSPRFNALVDAHFDGKSELTIWREIIIYKMGAKTKFAVVTNSNADSVPFPLPDHSLHSKIRFRFLRIVCIDHFVSAFLRSNQQIFDGRGTNLRLWLSPFGTDDQQIWDAFVRGIWPIFAPNIRRLGFPGSAQLDSLRRCTSPTILTDLNQLNSIHFDYLLPDGIGPNAATPTARQALFEWLHTPGKDGQPKQLSYSDNMSRTIEWVNRFKEAFLRSTTSSSYKIRIGPMATEIAPFELVNERTNEKLTLKNRVDHGYINTLKRCQIGGTTAVQWEDENLNNVHFWLGSAKCIGPMSPPKPGQKKKRKEK